MKIPVIKILWLLICAVLVSVSLFAFMAGPAKSETTNFPETIVIDYLLDEYGPVTFNHAMHADMAESCGECHHNHKEGMNSTCRECHSLDSDTFKASVKRGFPPCSGCHMEYSPERPGMPGLKVALHRKCFTCHVGMGELGFSPSGCKGCHSRSRSP